MVPSILAGHALSGCDTVPQFFGIGKKTVIKQLRTHQLAKHGEASILHTELFLECKEFITACYGFPKETCMSNLRYQVWRKKIESGRVTKSFKLCSLPPTKEAFQLNVLRAHFQCALWKSSLQANPPSRLWIRQRWSNTLIAASYASKICESCTKWYPQKDKLYMCSEELFKKSSFIENQLLLC